MSDFLLIIVGLPIATIASAEIPLFLYRKLIGLNRTYPFISAVMRMTAYSPCLLGVGHGATPFLLGPALWILIKDSNASLMWFWGVPEAVVGLSCFFISTAVCEEKLAKKSAPHAPDCSVYRSGWYYGCTGLVALVAFASFILHRSGVLTFLHVPAWLFASVLIVITLGSGLVAILAVISSGRKLVHMSREYLYLRAGFSLQREVAIPLRCVRTVYTDWGSDRDSEFSMNLIVELDLEGISLARESGVLVNSGSRWEFDVTTANKRPDQIVDLVRVSLNNAYPQHNALDRT